MSDVIIGFKAPKELRDRLQEHLKKNMLRPGAWLCKVLAEALDKEATQPQKKVK
jgi:hypothetical protein